MTKYDIIFGTDFNNSSTLSSQLNLVFFDNKDDKTISDAKHFITCVDDKICTCMLKLYTISKGILYNSYIRYDKNDEDSLPLKKIADNSYIYIGQTKKNCSCEFFENNKKLQKKSQIKDFYDIIIDVNSLIGLNEGWKIEFTEDGLKKYNEFKNQSLIKIGILGDDNKSKSFILSKLYPNILPSGASIKTKGLSIKYLELQEEHPHRNFILLNTAGLENPILGEENEEKDHLEDKNNEGINQFKIKARGILRAENFL